MNLLNLRFREKISSCGQLVLGCVVVEPQGLIYDEALCVGAALCRCLSAFSAVIIEYHTLGNLKQEVCLVCDSGSGTWRRPRT